MRIINAKPIKVKITAGAVLVSMISGTVIFPPSAYAAEPTVSVDEGAYVNLDYYGKISEVNIVKGYNLNGLTEFEDFGNYESVSNMSNYDQPAREADGVRWNLGKAEKQRFYANYKVKNDALELPWNIDVSYKLNGVPCKAEELAGASGVVEININVKPNAKAKPYYQNNMILQAATYVDMDDTYSLDAPGSQLQSVGTYKAVVFSALPGEEDTFTMRIGTNSFETKGITMMMMPGTLKQLEDIKELKEAKDTLSDSFNSINTSMNEFLNTMESMKAGLGQLQSGTKEMEDARSSFSSGKDQMNNDADTALNDLSVANTQLKSMIPYFQTGQNMIQNIQQDITPIIDSLNDLADPLDESESTISNMSKDLEALDSMLTQLNTQIGTSLQTLGALAQPDQQTLQTKSNQYGATPYDGAQLQELGKIAKVLGKYSEDIGSLLTEMQSMGATINQITNITQDLIKEADQLNNTVNSYQDDMTKLLQESEELTTLLNKSIDSSVVFLTYTKSLLQTSGDKLDKATETSLSGMTDVLEKSLSGLGSLPTMRNANNTIKETLDKELNKFEDENKFLNLDAKAPLVSLTSDQNPTPTSIQVVLRTKEINLKNNVSDTSDLETTKVDIGIRGRITNIFNKILSNISVLFSTKA